MSSQGGTRGSRGTTYKESYRKWEGREPPQPPPSELPHEQSRGPPRGRPRGPPRESLPLTESISTTSPSDWGPHYSHESDESGESYDRGGRGRERVSRPSWLGSRSSRACMLPNRTQRLGLSSPSPSPPPLPPPPPPLALAEMRYGKPATGGAANTTTIGWNGLAGLAHEAHKAVEAVEAIERRAVKFDGRTTNSDFYKAWDLVPQGAGPPTSPMHFPGLPYGRYGGPIHRRTP